MARPTPTQTRELDRAARSLRHEITQIRELLEAVCAARRRARHVRRRPVSRGLSGWRCEDQGELGPTRMDYPAAMASVRAVAAYVSHLLEP